MPVPDGWVMEASLGGGWQQIADLGGIGATSAGASFPVQASFDALVPRGGRLDLVASAASRSCNDTLFGHRLLDDLARFGFDMNAAFACLADRKQRDAGTVAVSIPAPRPGPFPDRYLVHAEGGAAAFALAFRVERVPGP